MSDQREGSESNPRQGDGQGTSGQQGTVGDNRPRERRAAIEQYQRAVALQYDGKRAPVVTASGGGQLAEDIVELARQAGVPLYENAELTEMLALLDLGEQIPHELYLLIAQIIALAYKISGKEPPLAEAP